jgi:hypothetical protein
LNVWGTPQVWGFITELEAWLGSDGAPDNVRQVAGPSTLPEWAGKLISADGRIALVGIGMSTPMDLRPTDEAVRAIDDWLAAHTPARCWLSASPSAYCLD